MDLTPLHTLLSAPPTTDAFWAIQEWMLAAWRSDRALTEQVAKEASVLRRLLPHQPCSRGPPWRWSRKPSGIAVRQGASC